MNVEILVATSEKIGFEMPAFYKPIQINSENAQNLIENYYHDNTGDNISKKNPNYCELTALYWGWKNSNSEIIGLCHYRRFFSKYACPNFRPFFKTSRKYFSKDTITEGQIKQFLADSDVIIGMPYLPYPKTAYEDLLSNCYENDIESLIDVVRENYFDYYPALKNTLNKKNLSYYNMMICRKNTLNEYCGWLFSILKEMETRCDLSEYSKQRKRLYGYLAEILLNVYIEKNNLKVKNVELLWMCDPVESSKVKIVVHDCEVMFLQIFRKGILTKFLELYYKIFKPRFYKSYLACLETLEKLNRDDSDYVENYYL